MYIKYLDLCDKVGGFILMYIDDLCKFVLFWFLKIEEVWSDWDYWGKNFIGDIYGYGWISEMYGYFFGVVEV